MNDTYKVRSVGGSLVVTLPQELVKAIGLCAGSDVQMKLVGWRGKNSILIERPDLKPKPNGKRGKS